MKKLTYLLFLPVFIVACTGTPENLSKKELLTEGWIIQRSEAVNAQGEILSTSSYEVKDWYAATVPTTVMAALVANGLYPDIFVGDNYKKVDKTQFDDSWWFRKEFTIQKKKEGEFISLNFDGISYYANIWLNGKQIASRDEVYGPFRRFSFDITSLVQENNMLAVEVFRAQAGDPNIGFVDWNPRPQDESMGLFREVYLTYTGGVDMQNIAVKSKVNTESLDEAWLTIETRLVNRTDKPVSGKLQGTIENISFSVPVELQANETKIMQIGSDDVPQLHIQNPRLWWCNNLGNPELYQLDLKFLAGNTVSDEEEITFGIREIKDYYTEEGYRGFMLNGKKVLVKSAGWTDDIYLRNPPERNELEVKYVKDMNLNSIRFENIWGNSRNIYELCDRYGLMALVGWSCQWEWEDYLGGPIDNRFGGIISEELINLIAESFEDQVYWLRNHPSIIAWFAGSDMIPHPDLERKYMAFLEKADDRPYFNSAGSYVSDVTGSAGVKMAGPYDYVAPNYWYIDSIRGGAYGFNTETGIGAQLPVYESIVRFIPQDKLWPLNELWDYHCTTSQTAMNNLNVLTGIMNKRYGKANDLQDYLHKADLINYEGTKAMFEAFRANQPHTTGIVQWMLNSAWPSLYWQLYDYYLIPTAAYYGVKQANRPRQLIYNYGNNSVYLADEIHDGTESLKAEIRMYSFKSVLVFEKTVEIAADKTPSRKICEFPKFVENAFLSLELKDKSGQILSRNFYWLSSQEDVYDWDSSSWYMSDIKIPANYKNLSDIPKASLKTSVARKQLNGGIELEVVLKNESPVIAFFIDLALKDDKGERIYPVFWEDNYISLLPEEERTVKCFIEKDNLPANSTLTISGGNVSVIVDEL